MSKPVMNHTGYESADDLRIHLKERCKKSSQKQVAAELEISEGYLSDLIKGRRDIGGAIADKLGYDMHVIYINKAD